MARTYAALPHEYLYTLADLNDAQFGRLIRWLLHYSATGESMPLVGREAMFMNVVRIQENRFQESYDRQVAVRHESAVKAAQARWKTTGPEQTQ